MSILDMVVDRKASQLCIVKVDKYKQFQRKYYNDFAAFGRDCIKWDDDEGLTPYQLEIINGILEYGRYSVRGLHGLGKTALSAIIVLAFALTRDGEDWKVVTTASAWRQLTKYLWPEIHKWARRLNWQKIGRTPFKYDELLTLSLKLSTGEAFAVASDNSDYIEGAHADHILYIFDESKAIPDATFDAAEGAFSGSVGNNEAYALAISTPGEPMGRFYDIHKRKPGYEDWHVRHVKMNEAISAGRISPEWVDQRRRQWGEKSALFQNRVVGEFASSDEDSIIPLAWVEMANERWQEWVDAGKPGTVTDIGGDVGYGGQNDKATASIIFDSLKVDNLIEFPQLDKKTATMQLAGYFGGLLNKYPNADAFIDVIGIGAGVVHRLKEQDQKVFGYNVSEKTYLRTRDNEFGFVNKRAAMWWFMRELLEPELGEDIALPPNDELIGELTSPKYKVNSASKIQVESKDDLRKRLGRSPDKADCVIHGLTGKRLAKTNVQSMGLSDYLKQRRG